MYIELEKGRLRWFYHVKSKNGNIILTSQKYFKKANAKRAALISGTKLNINVKEKK